MIAEFARPVAIDTIGTAASTTTIVADVEERARLAERFDLLDLGELAATITLVARAGAIDAEGRLTASVAQRCVTTGAPVVARIDHAFSLRFVDPAYLMSVAEETELSAADCDIVAHDGTTLDLGEAVAQTLALALDPFPRADIAEDDAERRWTFGADANPFAGLKTLLDKAR